MLVPRYDLRRMLKDAKIKQTEAAALLGMTSVTNFRNYLSGVREVPKELENALVKLCAQRTQRTGKK